MSTKHAGCTKVADRQAQRGIDLNGPEIARALMVSPNTVKPHIKSTYARLGANTRRAAVRRAAELALS